MSHKFDTLGEMNQVIQNDELLTFYVNTKQIF